MRLQGGGGAGGCGGGGGGEAVVGYVEDWYFPPCRSPPVFSQKSTRRLLLWKDSYWGSMGEVGEEEILKGCN